VTHIDVQRSPVIGANGLAPLLVAPGESVTAFLALAVNATTLGTPRQTRIATVVSRKKLWVGILGNSTDGFGPNLRDSITLRTGVPV
jgi:hypothetical protein